MYDVTQPSSLEKVHTWVEELNAHTENELRNEQNMSQDTNNGIILLVAGERRTYIPPDALHTKS